VNSIRAGMRQSVGMLADKLRWFLEIQHAH
jgi:hypothetical protein